MRIHTNRQKTALSKKKILFETQYSCQRINGSVLGEISQNGTVLPVLAPDSFDIS
jgi:hypothetical protein